MDVVSIKTPFIIYVRERGREKKGGGGTRAISDWLRGG